MNHIEKIEIIFLALLVYGSSVYATTSTTTTRETTDVNGQTKLIQGIFILKNFYKETFYGSSYALLYKIIFTLT